MQEILFRGFYRQKNGPNEICLAGTSIRGRWVKGYYVKSNSMINNGKCYILPNVSDFTSDKDGHCIRIGYFLEVEPDTVGQYSGRDVRADAFDSKVFAGDILQLPFDDEIQVVEWNDEFCRLMIHTYGMYDRKVGRKTEKVPSDGWCDLDDYPIDQMQKIGNAFENPEIISRFL